MRRVWLITQRPLKVLLALGLVLVLALVLDVCREFYAPWFENETEDEDEDEKQGKDEPREDPVSDRDGESPLAAAAAFAVTTRHDCVTIASRSLQGYGTTACPVKFSP